MRAIVQMCWTLGLLAAGAPAPEPRRQGRDEMMAWWCAKPQNGEDLPCMQHKMRAAAPEDRKKLKEEMMSLRKEGDGKGLQDIFSEWCGDNAPGKDSLMCDGYIKRMNMNEGKLEGKPPTEGSMDRQQRMADMKERRANAGPAGDKDQRQLDMKFRREEMNGMAEKFCVVESNTGKLPCLQAKIRQPSTSKEERNTLITQMKEMAASSRGREERDEMLHVWCGDDESKSLHPDERSVCQRYFTQRKKTEL